MNTVRTPHDHSDAAAMRFHRGHLATMHNETRQVLMQWGKLAAFQHVRNIASERCWQRVVGVR